ncbi:MAG: serine hydrolase [Planctomycetaceae bacterium]|nr:serine hydrolase [Planctomycetaceae bacterium]
MRQLIDRRGVQTIFLVVVFSVTASPTVAQPPTLQERLESLVESHEGQAAVVVKHLPTGESVAIHADNPMPTASLIKLAIMVEAYRQADAGKVDLSQELTLTDDDKVPGSGILTKHFSPGMKLSLRDAIRLMIAYSDNTATNLVLETIGLKSVSDAMTSLGCAETKIHSLVYRGETSIFPERSKRFGLGSTTAGETARLLEQLQLGELASADSTKEMLDHLRACESRSTLPRSLPKGTVVAHKTGSVNAARTAAGIIESPEGPIIVVVLTAENKDRRWTDDNAGERLCSRVAEVAYRNFCPEEQRAVPGKLTELTEGTEGWLVEALQRTLNAAAEPSPGLSVDGDFGPVTKQAVLEYQQSKGLAATGTVNAETWAALGPLLTSDEAVRNWEELTVELPDLKPVDSLAGPPFVTCRSWIVAAPESGDVLGGHQHEQPFENASTTKLMTAWIAIREVQREPDLLQEKVRVSVRADDTPGSTASLHAGEELTLQDLLYGLLLPSGNDASVVVAEHLGSRFDPPEDQPESEDPLVRFIAEMNRTAKSLGMTSTTFRNPHGLSTKDHATSTRDLFRLTQMIIQDGRLLPYLSTRSAIGKIQSVQGYTRYQLWTNTNRLLNIAGYHGMKTGTTKAAGACLVSLGERDGRQLVVIVLGSSSSDARYTDTRNLFRWGWQTLQQPMNNRSEEK